MRAEDRLTADHDELVVAGHFRGRGDHMLELPGAHLPDLAHDPQALGFAELARERRVLS